MNKRARKLRTLLLFAAALVVVGLALALDLTHALQRLEYTSVNERFAIRGQQKPPNDVVVVGIDDKTFDEMDVRWPTFRRKYHAQVIRNLTRAGAKVIAYDVQFTEPDADHPNDDDTLIEAVRDQPHAVMATTEVDAKTGKTRIFGGALGLRYSRAIPSNSNYENDSDGRIRHVAFKIDGLETFPLAAARAQLDGKLKVPAGQQRLDRLQGRHPEPAQVQLRRHLRGQVQGLRRARQGRGRRRRRARRCRTCTRPRPPAAA